MNKYCELQGHELRGRRYGMTEATFKNKKNRKASTDDRTEAQSYAEYSWENLINDKMVSAARAQNRAEALKRAAAAKRNMEAARARAGRTGAVGVSANTHKRASASVGGIHSGVKLQRKAKTQTQVRSRAEAVERIRTKTVVGVHTIISDKKYSFPISIVLLALCFTILIMAIITASVQRSELSSENDALKQEYTSLLSKKDELDLLLGTRDDLRVVEQVAKEELGMVKKDQVENFSIRVHNEDRIEILDDSDAEQFGFIEDIKNFGSSIAERVKGFFGM